MKITSISSCAMIALASLMTACSSSPENATGQIPQTYNAAPAKSAGLKDLYVADYDIGTIFLFKNDGFTPDGSITSGISGPWGVTLDSIGNLYVANADGADITEYAPGTSTPSFTYSAGMVSPRLVSVDRKGDVFETDFTDDYSQAGRVTEFAQDSNAPLYSCSLTVPWGVAVDSAGDVFVDYNASSTGGHIVEYKGGLAGCSQTELGVHVDQAFGLALDRHDNILLADYHGARIDVIPPPYTSTSRHLKTGGSGPTFVAIDNSNKEVFASAPGFYHDKVVVIDYASGEVERRLGGGRRLESAYGVVDAPNAVP
jgi:DNA-binding beta-propeller fold protein YncE